MRKIISIVLVMVFMCSMVGCGNNSSETGTNAVETTATPTDWKTVFGENGFTSEEISSYKEILTDVGITDYHDVEVYENGVMHIVRGEIFDSDALQLNVTLENRKIIYVTLAGIPVDKSQAYINWRGKLDFKTVQSKKSIDLYSDVAGGYIAKLDWDKKLITPFEDVIE